MLNLSNLTCLLIVTDADCSIPQISAVLETYLYECHSIHALIRLNNSHLAKNAFGGICCFPIPTIHKHWLSFGGTFTMHTFQNTNSWQNCEIYKTYYSLATSAGGRMSNIRNVKQWIVKLVFVKSSLPPWHFEQDLFLTCIFAMVSVRKYHQTFFHEGKTKDRYEFGLDTAKRVLVTEQQNSSCRHCHEGYLYCSFRAQALSVRTMKLSQEACNDLTASVLVTTNHRRGFRGPSDNSRFELLWSSCSSTMFSNHRCSLPHYTCFPKFTCKNNTFWCQQMLQ